MGITFSVAIVCGDTVRHYALEQAVTAIGRDAASDILIADPTISRHQLSLELRPDCVWVTMNPSSPNVMVRNGRAQMEDAVYPGEFFFVGPYRIEIHASAELPQARPRALDEDPAGPIDPAQLKEGERIAPRWRSMSAEPESEELHAKLPEAATDEAPSLSLGMRIALVGVLCVLGGYLIYDLTRDPPPAQAGAAATLADVDLLAVVKPISCQNSTECMDRAKDAHRIAVELIQGSARDLVTAYKIAKLLHRAQLVLGRDIDRIPDLKVRYTRARNNLRIIFADHAFYYQRAILEDQVKEQKQILQNILPICREDRQPFCDSLEQAYQRFPEKE